MSRKRRTGLLRIGVLALTALAAATACGSPPPPPASGTAVGTVPDVGTTATAAPRTPSDGASPATTIPPAPPTPGFVERAHTVADAVRAAGVPQLPDEIILLSSWAPGLGFDTVDQKTAWGSGNVVVGPAVPAEKPGVATMTVAADQRRVDLLGPRAALSRALAADTGGDCSGISVSECRLVLTNAVLASAEVRTSAGPATVPVWSFSADGLSRPIEIIAVAPGTLVPYSPPVSPPGIPEAVPGISGADALSSVAGTSITVVIGHGACDQDLRGQVVESDDLVVVGASHTPPPPGTMCHAIYLSTPTTLQLARPLGDRVVIDVLTGQPRFPGLGP